MPATLEDIAKISGYSRSTVSRVVNGEPGVNEKTRQRIMSVVEHLNYHPNQAARGLVAGRMNNIGLVIPETVNFIFTDPYFQYLALGVTQACTEREYSVMLWLSEPETERVRIKNFLNNSLIDGVVIASSVRGDPILQALVQSRRPFSLVGRQPGLPQINFVDMDNAKGAREAVRHLIQQGRRRIAHITGPMLMAAGRHRLEGYKECLREHHLPLDEALITEGDFTENGGYIATKKLLLHKPDAIFAASDLMAIGALRAIREHNLRVPHDVALVGFDDSPLAKNLTPPLTTIRQPVRKIGALAASILIDAIEDPVREPQQIILQPELVIRESCGSRPQ